MAKPNTISTIEAFERECHIRFENIDKRFDSGTKRFDKLEYLIYGQYGLILTAMIGLFIERLFY
jgi:hypothetical protein|tara:strand:+ start:9436 stop:9627 length:192 start_codon:yes stop_codon:yes gene_type:complete